MPAKKQGAVVVLCTCPTIEEAKALAHMLLERQLIACANVVNSVQSIYQWKGSICDDSEVLMVMKSTEAQADTVIETVASAHSYDVPEVLVLPVSAGYAPYLAWIGLSVSDGKRSPAS